eukprot:COSAG02_NODE_63450_length_263_cov_0.628049_1_plen_36_part_01
MARALALQGCPVEPRRKIRRVGFIYHCWPKCPVNVL